MEVIIRDPNNFYFGRTGVVKATDTIAGIVVHVVMVENAITTVREEDVGHK